MSSKEIINHLKKEVREKRDKIAILERDIEERKERERVRLFIENRELEEEEEHKEILKREKNTIPFLGIIFLLSL